MADTFEYLVMYHIPSLDNKHFPWLLTHKILARNLKALEGAWGKDEQPRQALGIHLLKLFVILLYTENEFFYLIRWKAVRT